MKVIVKYLNVKDEYLIEDKEGSDALLEAATLSLKDRESTAKELSEKSGVRYPFTLPCVMECYVKSWRDTKKHVIFNTYYVLQAAGMKKHAETLRTKFREQFNVDLSKEPYRA